MDRSSMTQEQIKQRQCFLTVLEADGWQLKNVEAFDNDLWLDAEITARKRTPESIMELNYSFENSYVSLAVAKFDEGRAEYVIYFDTLQKSGDILGVIVEHSSALTVKGAVHLAARLAGEYPGDVFFFTGTESIAVTQDTALTVFEKFNNELA
ncbi:hypothetical protein K7W42_05775 [Deinococcus sp. HMF7604]|uniref:hypothetical protein n=1 Tax=Deinococcus betulae TaxID=2873312 RepID=UPI001CCBD1FB|nr:hypothetical protein [Deinococcus betulae]MBZ9750371.1 hypothetical protein [Deinococcus betulae]